MPGASAATRPSSPLTGATVGAIVLVHRPGNLIGRLFLALGFLATIQFLAEEYLAVGVIAAPGSLPAVEWVAWTMNWLWIPQFVILVVFFLIFPDGRLLGPRWRAVLALAVIAGVIGILASAFMPGPLTDFKRVSNPIGFASAAQYGPRWRPFGPASWRPSCWPPGRWSSAIGALGRSNDCSSDGSPSPPPSRPSWRRSASSSRKARRRSSSWPSVACRSRLAWPSSAITSSRSTCSSTGRWSTSP